MVAKTPLQVYNINYYQNHKKKILDKRFKNHEAYLLYQRQYRKINKVKIAEKARKKYLDYVWMKAQENNSPNK